MLGEKSIKKKVKCKKCGDFGHFAKTCKLAEIGEDCERAPPRNKANKGTFLSTTNVSPIFTTQYVMLPCQCRKKAPTDEAGPSQTKKQKVQKKKGSPQKKKTPIKKKLKKAIANPPTTVVSSIGRLVYEDWMCLGSAFVINLQLVSGVVCF